MNEEKESEKNIGDAHMSQKFVAKVDQELKELIPSYLNNRKNEVIELRKLVQAKDAAAISQVGHKLKGNAGGYGFTLLGEIGAQLEVAGKNKNWDIIEKSISEIEQYLDHVIVEFVEVTS